MFWQNDIAATRAFVDISFSQMAANITVVNQTN